IAASANAVGSPAPAAQWQVSSDGLTWSNLPGATSYTLSFTASLQNNGKQYRCVFSNASGSATTTAMALAVQLRVRADVDDDRKSDLVIGRPSNGDWFWLNSADGYSSATAGMQQWGATSDIPLSGDIDGDGITDFIVFRPGTSPTFSNFYWITSSSGYISSG